MNEKGERLGLLRKLSRKALILMTIEIQEELLEREKDDGGKT